MLTAVNSMKYDAIVEQGIPIHERVPIPDDLIPEDSRVEIDAKIHAGYCRSAPVTIDLALRDSWRDGADRLCSTNGIHGWQTNVVISYDRQSHEHGGTIRGTWKTVGRCRCKATHDLRIRATKLVY